MVQNMMKQILIKILIAIGFLMLTVGLMVALLYGFGDEHLEEMEIRSVEGEVITKTNRDGFDLGQLPNREGSDYRGQAYEGYQDPTQVAMARELLEIYETSAKAETELLEMGLPLIDIIHFTIGTHLTESDTYNGQPGAPAKTYIPKTMVEWDKYNTATTAEGKIMNFTNYNAKDFEKDLIEDRKSLGLSTSKPFSSPGTDKSKGYRAGFRTKARSYTGAIGGTQLQPSVFKSNNLIQGNRTKGNPDWVKDPVAYAEAPNNSRSRSYKEGTTSDIFNVADGIRSTAGWMLPTIQGNGVFKRNKIDITKNPSVTVMYVGGSYLNGDGGFAGKIGRDFNRINKAYEDISKDKEGFNELFEFYKKSFGHGADTTIIHSLFEKHGVPGTSLGIVAGFENYSWVHTVRVWAKGVAWYEFLQGIAYGDQDNPGNPNLQPNVNQPQGNKGKVIYNYMDETNGIRKNGSSSIDEKYLDKYTAIGYKGPYPVFNQNMSYNENWAMGSGNNFTSGCTIYAASAGMMGLGLTPEMISFEKDGRLSPIEVLSNAHSDNNSGNPWDLRIIGRKPQTKFELGNIVTMIKKSGYEVNGGYTAKGNVTMRKEHIKQGYPALIKTQGGKARYTGYIPKTPLSKLDYRTHDMYDLDSYNWGSPQQIKLAKSGHHVIAIDIIEHGGKEYISIVDSAYNHSTTDSNIVWFEANELLTKTDYHNCYTILGASSLTPIGSTVGGSSVGPITGTGPPPASTDRYIGEDVSVAIQGITAGELQEEGMDRNLYANNTGSPIAGTIKGGYETQLIQAKAYERESSGVYVITGKSAEMTQAIEITNVKNPVRNSKGNRDVTKLFDLPSGQTAIAKAGFFRKSDGRFIYTDIRTD